MSGNLFNYPQIGFCITNGLGKGHPDFLTTVVVAGCALLTFFFV